MYEGLRNRPLGRNRITATLLAGAILGGGTVACSSGHPTEPVPQAFCTPWKLESPLYPGQSTSKGQKFGARVLAHLVTPNSYDQSVRVGWRSSDKEPYKLSKPIPMEPNQTFDIALGVGNGPVQFEMQAIANSGSPACVPEVLKGSKFDSPMTMNDPLATNSLPPNAVLPNWGP